jgi:hypothetical protein
MARVAELHDGTVLEFPDNTPDDVIERTVKSTLASRQQKAQPSATDRGAMWLSDKMDALTTTPYIGGTVRALRDRAQAVAQVAARPFASDDDMRTYESMRKGSEQKYQDFRAKQGDTGVDIDRMVGGAVIDAAVTSRLPGVAGGPAPTLLGRMRQGAAIGAGSGAMTPVESEKQGGEFWLTKGLQSGGGAAIGGLAPLVVEPAIAGVTAGVNKVVSRIRGAGATLAGQASDNAIEMNLSMTLKSEGVDWNKLSDGVRKSMIDDVRAAIKSGKPVQKDQLARYADFKSVTGETPTRGQLTLNPIQFKTEQNLKGIQGVGEELTGKLDRQNAGLFQTLDRRIGAVGSPNTSRFDAGASIADRLAAVNTAGQSQVRQAYTAAKAAAGQDAEVPMQRLAQTFGDMRNRLDMDLLPSPVRNRLQSFGLIDGKQTRSFTLAEAEDLIKTINANYDPMKPAAARALDSIRGAVRGAVNDMGDGGGPAAEAFRAARNTAAERFRLLESTPALQAARDAALKKQPLAPDNLIEKYVISSNAKVGELKNLIEAGGPQVQSDIRAAVLGAMRKAAQGKSPAGAEQFQFSRFADLVDRIGPEKLKAIFTPDEFAEINQIVRVGSAINFNPGSVTINRSGTSQAVIDAMQRVQGIPFLNKIVASPVMSAVQQNQAYNAANAGLSGVPGGLLSESLRTQLAEKGGLLGAAAVAPLPGLLFQ